MKKPGTRKSRGKVTIISASEGDHRKINEFLEKSESDFSAIYELEQHCFFLLSALDEREMLF
jgi:hypothetical protein